MKSLLFEFLKVERFIKIVRRVVFIYFSGLNVTCSIYSIIGFTIFLTLLILINLRDLMRPTDEVDFIVVI